MKKVVPNTTQNCNYFGPYGNLQNCELFNDNLAGANLIYANMTGADLTQANIEGVDLNETELSGVNITYTVQNCTITGTPASLPSSTVFVGSYLLGPGVYLNSVSGSPFVDVDFATTDLSLANAHVQSDDFSGDAFAATTDFDDTNLPGAT